LTAEPLGDDGLRLRGPSNEGNMAMNREELVALRDAIDTVLTWPDAVRDQIAAWLAPEATKGAARGNGLDPRPAPISRNDSIRTIFHGKD
jgi:hypothetical protein